MAENIVFLPHWGEFGWLVMTHIRYVHGHQADEKVVCCQKGEECLFPSANLHYFVENPFPDYQRHVNGAIQPLRPAETQFKQNLMKTLSKTFRQHQFDQFPSYQTAVSYAKLVKFMPTVKRKLNPVDVVLGARLRGNNSRNFAHWEWLASELIRRGLSVGVAGDSATSAPMTLTCIERAWDHPDGPTFGSVNLLADCRVYCGVDSGMSHLAALMDTPMIVLQQDLRRGPPAHIHVMKAANHRYLKIVEQLSAWNYPEILLQEIVQTLEMDLS
jgi:ADP-heptose:LPS heptosyltransferase